MNLITAVFVLDQSHLHPPLTKHWKSMLGKPPTFDSLGPQDDSRSYKLWEEMHSRIIKEPPREGREYIKHLLNIFPFIEPISGMHPIASGESFSRRNRRLLRLIIVVLLSYCQGVQESVGARTDPGGKRNACGCSVSRRNGHDAGVPRVSVFRCTERKL